VSTFTSKLPSSHTSKPWSIAKRWSSANEPRNADASALIASGCQDQLDVLVESQPDLSAPAG